MLWMGYVQYHSVDMLAEALTKQRRTVTKYQPRATRLSHTGHGGGGAHYRVNDQCTQAQLRFKSGQRLKKYITESLLIIFADKDQIMNVTHPCNLFSSYETRPLHTLKQGIEQLDFNLLFMTKNASI